jgi:hypothetical protein
VPRKVESVLRDEQATRDFAARAQQMVQR